MSDDFHKRIVDIGAVKTDADPKEMEPITTSSGHRYVPRENRVLIRELNGPSKSTGGIYLPPSAHKQKQQRMGVVMGVGPGLRNHQDPMGPRIPMDIEVGTVVHYGAYAGNEVEIDDKTFKVIRDSELFGQIEDYDVDVEKDGADVEGVEGYS